MFPFRINVLVIKILLISISSIKKKVKKGSGSKTLPSNSSPVRGGGGGGESPGARRVEPTEALGTAVVKYNYQAQQPDELALTKGTRILILEKSNDGWWRGQYQGHTGWYMESYVLYNRIWSSAPQSPENISDRSLGAGILKQNMDSFQFFIHILDGYCHERTSVRKKKGTVCAQFDGKQFR